MNTKHTIITALTVVSTLLAIDGKAFDKGKIPHSAQEVRPLLIGAEVPAVNLKTSDGKAFILRRHTTDKPSILIFYRGGWCPFCNRHLAGLGEIESKLTGLGYQILAISPDRPAKLTESQDKAKHAYTLLSDSHMKAAQAFGIAFSVGPTHAQDAGQLQYRYRRCFGRETPPIAGARYFCGGQGRADRLYLRKPRLQGAARS